MSDNNYCVYVHRNKLNNKIYVGMTNNATLRFSGNGTQYKPRGGAKEHHSIFWNAIQKYGWDNFSHHILEENLSKEQAELREQYYIFMWQTQDHNIGYNIADGGNGGRIYKVHPQTGKPRTEQAKLKQAKAMMKDYVVCLNTGKVYLSASQADKETGFGKMGILALCNHNGRYKTVGKLENGEKCLWMWKSEYDAYTASEIKDMISKVQPNKRDMGYEYVVIYNNQEYVYHTLEDMINEYFNNEIAVSNVARIMKSEKPYKFKKIKQQKYNGIMIEKREV